jgi:hypothetical protein
MGGAGGGWGWIETDLVRGAGAYGLGHGVVDFEDDTFGVVLAVSLFILTSWRSSSANLHPKCAISSRSQKIL